MRWSAVCGCSIFWSISLFGNDNVPFKLCAIFTCSTSSKVNVGVSLTSWTLNRGSYISAHCFIEFIKQDGGKKIKCEACRAFYLFFATSLINSIIQEH